jgi:hypothetical protein
MAAPIPEYTYDPVSGRYRSRGTGRYVSGVEIRGALDVAIDAAAKDMRAVSEQLRAGAISLAEWQLAMERGIKNMHVASGAAAKGGWAQMSQSDWGRVGKEIQRQYEYLRTFAEQIATGRQKLNGQFLSRAEMYVQSARTTFHEIERREQERHGMDEERRERHSRDSCPTCVDQARLGWQPIGTLRRIGDSECRTRCRCGFVFRYSSETSVTT